jgi:hypothetical protein
LNIEVLAGWPTLITTPGRVLTGDELDAVFLFAAEHVPGDARYVHASASARVVAHDESATRDERKLALAARLLPIAVRDRHIHEWLDHLACERETGGDPRHALRSILLRAIVPLAIASHLRRVGRTFVGLR